MLQLLGGALTTQRLLGLCLPRCLGKFPPAGRARAKGRSSFVGQVSGALGLGREARRDEKALSELSSFTTLEQTVMSFRMRRLRNDQWRGRGYAFGRRLG